MNSGTAPAGAGVWLNGARWDLTWLMGTAAVIPVTLLFVWGGVSSDLLNLIVTLLAGGPHVFSTFLTTYLDPEYRRRHGLALVAIAVTVPSLVVLLAVTRFQGLMSFFIFAASFHVLQQNAYLADAYRRRAARPDPLWSRILDYAVLFLSFYPIASYKLVRDEFLMGELRIVIPDLVKHEATWRVVSVLFAASALAWGAKTIREWRRGALNVPKTALILLTSTIAFAIPATAAGARLELAFQSVNAWHSLQYLGLIWLILSLRKSRGRSVSPALDRLSGPGRPTLRFYGLCVVFTLAMLVVIFALTKLNPFGVSAMQNYYIGVFSFLFIHYALDGYFFLAARGDQRDPEDVPFLVPVRPSA